MDWSATQIAEAEIRRHHRDFERWEEMAAKGSDKLGAGYGALNEPFNPLRDQLVDTVRSEL